MNKFALVALIGLAVSGCSFSDSSDRAVTADMGRVVTVEKEGNLAQRIDAGIYMGIDQIIRDNFVVEPIPDTYRVYMVSVQPNRIIGESADVVAEMQKRGLRPANTAECLAYAEMIAAEQWPADMGPSPEQWVCLGSTVPIDGYDTVLTVARWRGKMLLITDKPAGGWYPYHRFVGVRI